MKWPTVQTCIISIKSRQERDFFKTHEPSATHSAEEIRG